MYAFNLRDAIPSFHLPLESGESEPLVELQTLLNGVYDRASFDMGIDYDIQPVPQLKPEDAVWVDELLRTEKLRGTVE